MITPLIISAVTLLQLYILLPFTTLYVREIVKFFLVGAFAATIASFVINGLFTAFIDPNIVSYTINPVVEETLKIAFLLFVLFRTANGSTFGVSDGLLLGAALGGGFGCAEDTLRALAIGRAEMEWVFPQYALSNLPSAVLSWLPTGAAHTFADGVSFYRSGHLEWTAFAAIGAALFFRFRNRGPWAWLALLLPLIWAIWDHASVNLLSQHANILGDAHRPDGTVRQIHDLLARGWAFHYAFSAMVFIASLIDWRTIRSGLRREQCAFLANASQRPSAVAGDLSFIGQNADKGWPFFKELRSFFRLRRQMAFAAATGTANPHLRQGVYAKKLVLKGVSEKPEAKPEEIDQFVKPGRPVRRATWARRLYLLGVAWVLCSAAMVLWYILLSLYFPSEWRVGFQKGSLFVACGATGFAMAIVTAIAFHLTRRSSAPRLEDRAGRLAEAVLVYTGLVMVALPVLQISGLPPFQQSAFFWASLIALLAAIANSPFFLGLASLLVDLSPAGNIKSAIEALTGIDPVARTRLGLAGRLLAALGALPILGQGLKLAKAALKLGAGVVFLGAVKAGKWASKGGKSAKAAFGALNAAGSSFGASGKLGTSRKLGASAEVSAAVSKDALRAEARQIAKDVFSEHLGKRVPQGTDIHHRIPLEYQDLFPDLDPNRLENLIAVTDKVARDAYQQSFHGRVHDLWQAHIKDLGSQGITPTKSDIENIASQIDKYINSNWPKAVNLADIVQ